MTVIKTEKLKPNSGVNHTHQRSRNSIAAIQYISLSEIQYCIPGFDSSNESELNKVLWAMGLDNRNFPYETQDLQHRNKMNQIVSTNRYVGNERTDSEWVNSEYSSSAVKDKVLGNRLLNELYSYRGVTEDNV
jgi:hypothetical protein